MTKIGIMSDLHMEFMDWDFTPEPGVHYICAGDISSNPIERQAFISKHLGHLFWVMGNHDYYGSHFPFRKETWQYKDVLDDGTVIIGATLWTDLSNPIHYADYLSGLIDNRHIKWISHEAYIERHEFDKMLLLNAEADIIVSHHAPSFQSLHPRYANEKTARFNPSFMSDLDEQILAMKKPPKLWIHGHVHDPFDYTIGETRVICYPRGYPNENKLFNGYQPKVIEI